ncbi:Tetrathionate reductase subunit C [Edwardsiella anguillarum]|uniref:NrfD/PsrC family molybdoenzyme membrane anchor subunit n=1 Tax=Edwardsiella TaxID=635 RepID=UPI001F234F6C|nr:NrfD/PsrC family molybdoenzyme membrane anchor subunit [Edwardsiella anguillarum]BET80836.1 Tetrathionate reductase subunit C [Edwardsiella anguillarum]BET84125.1 Tetrathionate reductase subunit C [Edwardsiella anguillarum]BET87491.1 Tetrathionate reductase subunit C [Edwardsiella anguillarum]BET90918.1 Tetrathionate reductase subunit C [Edwardsiella anguillarum]
MIRAILVAPQPVAWLPWAVQYFFYIGSAYGAALLLWLALRRSDSYSVTFIRAMALVLLISCVVGPLALTADLHQPGRAWHFFAYLTPGSWMSRGALLLPLFSLLGVATGWLCLRPALQEAARTRWSPLLILLAAGRWSAPPALVRLCALLTVLSGASIALYTGSEVGIVAARPLWHQWGLPWLWLCSAPLVCVGLWALVRGLLDRPVTATDRRLLLLACWLFWPTGRVGAEGLSFMRAQAWPAALLTLAASQWLTSRRWPVALLAIGAAASLRWLTLIDVQRVPRYDAGIYPYTLAIGSEGVAGDPGHGGTVGLPGGDPD